jgi:monovalent cation/proton antiporter MnhG/PhaG subunit
MVAAVLLAFGVAVELLACAGVVLMPTALDRLHYASAGVTATLLVAAAVVVREGATTLASRALLVALVSLFTAPVLTHATARAIDERER